MAGVVAGVNCEVACHDVIPVDGLNTRTAKQVKHITAGAVPAVVMTPKAGQSVAAIATAPSRRAKTPAV